MIAAGGVKVRSVKHGLDMTGVCEEGEAYVVSTTLDSGAWYGVRVHRDGTRPEAVWDGEDIAEAYRVATELEVTRAQERELPGGA